MREVVTVSHVIHGEDKERDVRRCAIHPSPVFEKPHVLPALIRKMHEAKLASQPSSMSPQPSVAIWGTGTPRREFMYSDDLADACVFLMERHDAKDIGELINIGVGEDHTIREIAEMVQGAVGFTGRLHFDASKPDGTPQKLLDVSRLTALGWRAKTDLRGSTRIRVGRFPYYWHVTKRRYRVFHGSGLISERERR